jgi:U3 small nucleolar RNA-associated protein 7
LAQQKHLFVYDNQGTEIHKLPYSEGIEYLPYHFLLASYTPKSLTYYDTSTGVIVAEHSTRQPYTTIRQNHSNAVIALGTAKGTVEWWTPGSGRAAIQLFVGASIVDVAFHKNYMVTASESIKVWDTRMLKVVNQYPTHKTVSGVEISATGILAVNYSHEVEFLRDACQIHQTHPYMKYASPKNVRNMRFVPFEDVIGLGETKGFSSIIIPGSGDPNYDTFEFNPFESKKQKR